MGQVIVTNGKIRERIRQGKIGKVWDGMVRKVKGKGRNNKKGKQNARYGMLRKVTNLK